MLRAIIGTDNALKTTNPVVGATFADWWSTFGHPGMSVGTNINKVCVDQDGWISAMTNSADQIVPFSMNGYVPANPNKLTIGFRIKTLAVYANAHSIVHLNSGLIPNDISCYLFLAGPSGAPWLTGVGVEYYVELTYDFVAGTVATKVNGASLASYTPPAMSAAIKAQWVAGNGSIAIRLANSPGGRYAVRDIYVLDDVAGDGMTAPLGDQKMYPLYLDSAVGVDWVTSTGTGTLLDALLAPPPATTTANSPGSKSPLDMSLRTSAPSGTKVNGVQINLVGNSLGAGASTSKVEVSLNGSTSAAKFPTVPPATPTSTLVGLYSKAPDGTAWDTVKLDTAAVKLTPDTVA